MSSSCKDSPEAGVADLYYNKISTQVSVSIWSGKKGQKPGKQNTEQTKPKSQNRTIVELGSGRDHTRSRHNSKYKAWYTILENDTSQWTPRQSCLNFPSETGSKQKRLSKLMRWHPLATAGTITELFTQHMDTEYLVMPYGLTNAPAIFQSLINEVFRDMLNQFVIAYIHDILIYSTSLEEHITHVHAVLQCLTNHNLYVKVEKCEFHCSSVTFLGYVISQEGVEME